MNKQILIVDDESTNRLLLRRFLNGIGHESIVEARDGLEALEKIIAASPDMIFLDIMMPRLDGLLLCEILHGVSRFKQIPVVLQSALAGAENVRRGLEAGAIAYLEKPISKAKLQQILEDAWSGEKVIPGDLPASLQHALDIVINAAKHTFNLTLGVQTSVTRIESVNSAPPRAFDCCGKIPASGQGHLDLSLGCDRSLSVELCQALLLVKPEEVDDELIGDTIREVLNMLMGVAVSALVAEIPLKLGLPTSSQESPLYLNPQAAHGFAIDFSLKGQTVSTLLSVQ